MPKKLIVCSDGTWNSENETDHGHPCPTNVVRMARAILPKDSAGVPQISYYHSGVGTNFGQRVRGGAFGLGLFANALDCYRFLVLNYEPGDSLYFFGFSRGAYTVRSLAGLVRNSGILRRGHENQESVAVELYRDHSDATSPDSPAATSFREEHSYDADIELIGVWDTVGALGIPNLSSDAILPETLRWQFHDVSLSRRVNHAYHALAIHEHRAEFVPSIWEKQPDAPTAQVLEQVWFSGVHADVGGGYPQTGLSDIAFQWMAEKAMSAGLQLDPKLLSKDGGIEPDPLAEGHDSFALFYRMLDFIEGKKGGSMRTFESETAARCESLHESVLERYRTRKPAEKWPQSFADALAGL